jgi:hypothetical protein
MPEVIERTQPVVASGLQAAMPLAIETNRGRYEGEKFNVTQPPC